MTKSTFLSLGAAGVALSVFSPVLQAQTTTTATTPVPTTTETSATPVEPPAPVTLPPSVPRKLRYVKLKNAPARQVALQLGWLNSGPSYSGAMPTPTLNNSITSRITSSRTTTPATNTTPNTPPVPTNSPNADSTVGKERLSPEVLYFVPVESQNAITFFASDEEAKTLTDEIRSLDVTQPKIRVEVRVYEPKSPEDVASLFTSAQSGVSEGILRPIDEAVLTKHANLISSQTLETTSSATIDLSDEKLLKDSDLNWQVQTTATPDGQLTLRVSRDAQIQTALNLAPISSGQLLAISTDRALQSPDQPRRLVVFVPTIEPPKTPKK